MVSIAVAAVAIFTAAMTFRHSYGLHKASEVAQDVVAPRTSGVRSGTILANRDIVALARSGVASRTIIRLIERHQCRFNVSPAEMIAMKENGVGADVIDAIVSNLDQCETATAPVSNVAHLADLPDTPAPTPAKRTAVQVE